jgi:hypothetical protein
MVSRRLIRRIERAGAVAASQTLPALPAPAAAPSESRVLAREAAEAFGALVRQYREQFSMPDEQARQTACATDEEAQRA